MGIKITQNDATILKQSIVKIAEVLINCDSDCNQCVLKRSINMYDSAGGRMSECDLLYQVANNLL